MSQLKVNSIVPVGGLPSGANGGIIQVVSATKTDTASFSSTSFQSISGLSVTITPSSNSNKILICSHINFGENDARYQIFFKLTGGNCSNYVGDSGTGVQCASCIRMDAANTSYMQGSLPLLFLDEPATTSATTYQVQVAVAQSQTVKINAPYTSHSDAGLCASTITAYEVSV